MKLKFFSKNEIDFSIEHLRTWFEEEKRDFPWRRDPTPYRVWVSEVMLQQTVASVVVPYFERWMARFPTVEALAESGLEEVIKLWEGLGYYSRARALHEGARYLVEMHGGALPDDAEALGKVKGLGPYTVGAILSFAFHQKANAVDGNVLRVMARLLAIHEEIDRPSVQKEIRQKVEELLPDTKPWVIMEALIELGARICRPKPTCLVCPLQGVCTAYTQGLTDSVPKRRKRQGVTLLKRKVLLIHSEGEFLIQKQAGKKVMADLFEFPYFEGEAEKSFYPEELERGLDLALVTHTFTRYRAELSPILMRAPKKRSISGYSWVAGKSLTKLPFSSGHRKILTQLLEEHAHLTH